MKPLALALLIAAALFAFHPSPSEAQTCPYPTWDMAGMYTSPTSVMALSVGACGSVGIAWDNAYGSHAASYFTSQNARGGGYAANWTPAAGGMPLDAMPMMVYKPAEPGWIQVGTFDQYGNLHRVYRLQKIR